MSAARGREGELPSNEMLLPVNGASIASPPAYSSQTGKAVRSFPYSCVCIFDWPSCDACVHRPPLLCVLPRTLNAGRRIPQSMSPHQTARSPSSRAAATAGLPPRLQLRVSGPRDCGRGVAAG
jgi:hypothetical protein